MSKRPHQTVAKRVVNRNEPNGCKLYLNQVINDAHWQDNDKEERSAIADDGDGAEDAQCTDDPRVQAARQLWIHDVDVFGETIDDATDRRAVKEGHRRSKSALENGRVK